MIDKEFAIWEYPVGTLSLPFGRTVGEWKTVGRKKKGDGITQMATGSGEERTCSSCWQGRRSQVEMRHKRKESEELKTKVPFKVVTQSGIYLDGFGGGRRTSLCTNNVK